MRSKEEAHDYRYFPDPDLLPLEFDEAYVAALAESLPELPDAKRARFLSDYGLSTYDADVLVADRATADFFEAVARGRDGKQAANWVINELLGALNRTGTGIEASPVSAAQLGELLDLQKDGTISGKIAKDVFEIMLSEGGDPRDNRRGARAEAGDRHRRDREDRGRDHRRQSGEGGAGEGEAGDARLVRRPGDEGEPRQGQPAGGQRASEGEARDRVQTQPLAAAVSEHILT